MEKIKSFEIDHNIMTPGLYYLGTSHNVYTYDLRFKRPNDGDYISYKALHSIEHLFAVVIRNSAIKDNVIYFGPMGCRTGFYLLLFGIEKQQALEEIKLAVEKCLQLDYVPGNTAIECGNYLEHSLEEAHKELLEYQQVLNQL